jgi:hypothetical protein
MEPENARKNVKNAGSGERKVVVGDEATASVGGDVDAVSEKEPLARQRTPGAAEYTLKPIGYLESCYPVCFFSFRQDRSQ